MKTRLFPDNAHAEAQSEATRVAAHTARRRVRTVTGKRALQQSLMTLIQDRLNDIEINLAEVRHGIVYWDAEADPETVDGKEAYQHLSRLKNRRRALEAQLKTWKQRQLELKVI